MMHFELGEFRDDLQVELGKLSGSQQDMVMDYMEFMKRYTSYMEKNKESKLKGFLRKITGTNKDILKKMREIQEDVGINVKDLQALDLMVFELRGIECNIVDFSVLLLLLDDIERNRKDEPIPVDVNYYDNPLQDILISYYTFAEEELE